MDNMIIQLIGVVAWIFLLLSYKAKDTKSIIFVQLVSSLLYVIHYGLLNAYSGLFVCLLALITGLLYYFIKNKKLIYLLIIPIVAASAYFFYDGVLSLMPMIAVLLDEYSFTKHKNTILKYSVISHILWVIYDYSVLSYSCIVTDGLVAISNMILLISHYNTNLLKVDRTRPFLSREELFK